MAFDAVKIPQNVYVEDRVIGPITLRQIFMTLAGGGVSYVIWSLMKAAGYVSLIAGAIALIPTIIMLSFAFVKINEISLFRFCLLIIEKQKKPTVRYFQPRTGVQIRFLGASKSVKDEAEEELEEESIHTKNISDIEKLSSVLDTKVLKAEQEATPTT